MKALILSLYLSITSTSALAAPIYIEHPTEPHTIIICTGVSMLPAFPVKGLIEVDNFPFSQLKSGMTILYHNQFYHSNLNHRLIRWTGKGWIARGDNNKTCDLGLVTERNYMGVTKLIKELK